MDLVERDVAGIEYLSLATGLLQRARLAGPDDGLWEAADLHWWWRRDQHRDPGNARFWIDSHGTPVAAVVFNDFGSHTQCDVLASTAADAPWRHAMSALADRPTEPIEIAVRDDDPAAAAWLRDAGFAPTADAYITCVMEPGNRPTLTALPPGYRLLSRSDAADRPHHMIRRNGQSVAQRLAECSLYRPELDLFVEGPEGDVAAYGLFWPDPVTGVGLVEPMRTDDAHQGKGVATHMLLAGLGLLADNGCSRLKVTHEEANAAAQALYRRAGFEPLFRDTTYRRAHAPTA
jgi:GNAT superfamily N-acetyltransferase